MGEDEEAKKLAAATGAPETPVGKRRRKSNEFGGDDVRDKTVITPAGETYSTQEHPASECDASMFRLRVGPDYRKTGKKEASGPALFKLEAVDLVRTETAGIADPLSHFKPVLKETGVEGTNVPPSFIVHANMPMENPSMFGNPETAASFVIVFHFTATDALTASLKDLANAPPAVKLLNDWCGKAGSDRNEMGRFKAMCIIDDIETHGFPSFISRFNGKPVLINRSGSFDTYTKDASGSLSKAPPGPPSPNPPALANMGINVHVFALIARKGLFQMREKFKSMSLNVAFTIEGRENDELPEVVLGCATVKNMDVEKMVRINL